MEEPEDAEVAAGETEATVLATGATVLELSTTGATGAEEEATATGAAELLATWTRVVEGAATRAAGGGTWTEELLGAGCSTLDAGCSTLETWMVVVFGAWVEAGVGVGAGVGVTTGATSVEFCSGSLKMPADTLVERAGLPDAVPVTAGEMVLPFWSTQTVAVRN